MDIFVSSIDLVRIVFLLGAVLALLYKKNMGVTPGGIIVPGTLVGILFTSFIAFIITIISSIACWLIYKRFIARFALSNRWTSLVSISLSASIGLILLSILGPSRFLDQETLLLSLVVPGLITISSKKYGLGRTMSATLLVTSATGIAGLALANIIPVSQLTSLSVQLAVYTPLVLTNPYLVLPVSLIAALLAYYRFGIRAGGYLIAPFLAVILLSSWIQALLVAASVALSYFIVAFIQRHTLIIGLERFVLSLFIGYFMVSLMDFLAISVNIVGYRPSALILITAIAVITNDLCLQKPRTTIKKGVAPALLLSCAARLAV